MYCCKSGLQVIESILLCVFIIVIFPLSKSNLLPSICLSFLSVFLFFYSHLLLFCSHIPNVFSAHDAHTQTHTHTHTHTHPHPHVHFSGHLCAGDSSARGINK